MVDGTPSAAVSGPYSDGMLRWGREVISEIIFRTTTDARFGMSRVITARNDPEATRAYWTMSRGDAERAFHAARRHSRVVRILRIAVPAGVAVGIIIITLITYLNPLRMLAKLPINLDNLVVSGTKVTMERPRLTGFTRDARAYELTADTAAQDMTKPDIVELRNIRAKVEMQDKSSMELTAGHRHL